MTLFVLFFPACGHLGIPKHWKTRENAKLTNRPFFTHPPVLPLFGNLPFSKKALPRQFQPQSHANWGRRDFCIILDKDCRLEVANPFLEGVNLHFRGCQFTFGRMKLSCRCFIAPSPPNRCTSRDLINSSSSCCESEVDTIKHSSTRPRGDQVVPRKTISIP